MNTYEDYANYMMENNDLIIKIKNQALQLNMLLEDVIIVTDHIYKLSLETKIVDDELGEIFEAGYGYIVNTLLDIKSYLEICNFDFNKLLQFETLIFDLLYLDDIKYYLLGSEEDKEKIKEIELLQEEIDKAISSKAVSIEENDKFLLKVEEFVPSGKYKPAYVVFSLIREELNLI